MTAPLDALLDTLSATDLEPAMTATVTPPTCVLWTDLGGSLYCLEHAGGYLQAAVEARPKARSHSTPITVWRLVTDKDRDEWDSYGDLPPMTCERCRETGLPDPLQSGLAALTLVSPPAPVQRRTP